jgi:CRISPR-associated protein Cas5d
MTKNYRVQIEVAGPLAMFARPDTGGTPTSYPAPTWSAAKGIFESIAFLASGEAWICPTKIEICRKAGGPGGRINFQRYTTNYGGPLRKKNLFNTGSTSGGSSMQLFATVISGACYRLYGEITGHQEGGGVNVRHYLKDLFDRRLKQGRCFRTPCLGWSEFTCSYWGPFRDGVTEVDTAISLEVPSMLLAVWDHVVAGNYAPSYSQETRIDAGALEYKLPPKVRVIAGLNEVVRAE